MLRKEICVVGLSKEKVEGIKAIFDAGLEFSIAKEYPRISDALGGIVNDAYELFIIELPPASDHDDFFKFLRLASLSSKLVVITDTLELRVIQKCIQYGTSGLIHAKKMGLLIYRCVEKVFDGEVFICSGSLEILVNSLRTTSEDGIVSLREREVLELLSMGLSYSEISNSLNISLGTTKSHVSNIYKKLKVRNITEAVLQARHHKLIE